MTARRGSRSARRSCSVSSKTRGQAGVQQSVRLRQRRAPQDADAGGEDGCERRAEDEQDRQPVDALPGRRLALAGEIRQEVGQGLRAGRRPAPPPFPSRMNATIANAKAVSRISSSSWARSFEPVRGCGMRRAARVECVQGEREQHCDDDRDHEQPGIQQHERRRPPAGVERSGRTVAPARDDDEQQQHEHAADRRGQAPRRKRSQGALVTQLVVAHSGPMLRRRTASAVRGRSTVRSPWRQMSRAWTARDPVAAGPAEEHVAARARR